MKIKRFLAGVLCLLLLVGTLTVGSVSAADTVWGEVDGTPGITASDALYVLQYVVSLIKLDDTKRLAADVSGDGMVTASDALLILQYVVNLIDRFPADKEDDTASSDPVSSELTSSELTSSEPVSSEDPDSSAASSEPTSSEEEDPGDGGIQDAPEDPAEELIKKTYNPWSKGGIVYKQLTRSFDAGEIRTTFQNSGTYNETIDVPSDSTMVYLSTISQTKGGYYASWSKAQNSAGKSLDIMIPGGRDDGKEYYSMYPDRGDKDAQKNADGSIRYHTAPVAYMCPTASYVDYKLKLVQACCALNPGFIAIEEPECWMEGGYNEGFKEEWKKYYGTEWQDPKSSPEARFKASKLMVHLFVQMFTTIGQWMEENYPEVDLVVATHSGPNYIRHSIAAGINSYTALPYVDGIIAQVWSDTINTSQPFETGWLGYASFGDSMQEGQVVYALTDAKADNANLTWDDCKRLWKKSITAQLMQTSINNFQECVWPTRGFTPADRDYKASQLNVFKVMSNVGGKTARLYAGTPGISIAYGDSFTWQKNYSNWMTESTADKGLQGQAHSLVEVGIPVTVTSLDYIKSAKDLEGVNLLLVSYDVSKPLSERANVAIASWVKQGGTVLYVGGSDDYENIAGEWWSNKGQTPYQNLISHLGLNVSVSKPNRSDALNWVGDGKYGNSLKNVSCTLSKFINTYSGSGITKILSFGNDTIGYEATVGEGHFISVGVPSSFFYNHRDAMRDLVKYAVKYTDVTYTTTDLMTIQRGDYVISETLSSGDGATLTGDFIDLFDPNLTIMSSVAMKAGESSLLFDLTRWRTQGTPRLAFTGGDVKGTVVESAKKTKFTISGPSDSYSSSRLLGNGLYPQKISAVTPSGSFGDYVAMWDNATSSLLIKTNHAPNDPVSFVVEWGTTPIADTVPYERVNTTIAVHQSNYDSEFIFSDKSTASRTIKRCEYGNQLIYCFDTNKYSDLYVDLTVAYNYKIEVSSDNLNYQTLASYDAEEPATSVKNRIVVRVHASEFAGADGKVYIRLGNSKPTNQYGTGISELGLNYYSPLS